jgi:hypothetical protein
MHLSSAGRFPSSFYLRYSVACSQLSVVDSRLERLDDFGWGASIRDGFGSFEEVELAKLMGGLQVHVSATVRSIWYVVSGFGIFSLERLCGREQG